MSTWTAQDFVLLLGAIGALLTVIGGVTLKVLAGLAEIKAGVAAQGELSQKRAEVTQGLVLDSAAVTRASAHNVVEIATIANVEKIAPVPPAPPLFKDLPEVMAQAAAQPAAEWQGEERRKA